MSEVDPVVEHIRRLHRQDEFEHFLGLDADRYEEDRCTSESDRMWLEASRRGRRKPSSDGAILLATTHFNLKTGVTRTEYIDRKTGKVNRTIIEAPELPVEPGPAISPAR